MLTGKNAHAKIVCNSVCVCTKFSNFTHGKCAGTCVYPDACIKFKISYTILLLNVIDFGKTHHIHTKISIEKSVIQLFKV